MVEHEVVVLHLHLSHFLGHPVVFIKEFLMLWVSEFLKVLELVDSYSIEGLAILSSS